MYELCRMRYLSFKMFYLSDIVITVTIIVININVFCILIYDFAFNMPKIEGWMQKRRELLS